MKKIKIAFTAIACSAIIGTSIAGALPFAPGDYSFDPDGLVPIPGEKGPSGQWDCDTQHLNETCAYLEVENNQRVPIAGRYTENP